MARGSFCDGTMIAPELGGSKSPFGKDKGVLKQNAMRCNRAVARYRRAHEFVNGIILLPNFRQSGVKLEWDTEDCCLRARSGFERRFLSPPAPRGLD